MGIKPLFITLISFLLFPTLVLAASAPTLSAPSNNSTTTSSNLTWSIVDNATSYRIQVDDQPDFSSPNKDYTTTNTSYSPNLTEGSWSWRVKAKSNTGEWGDWSESWNFNLTNPTPTPTPSPTENPSPTATASQTPSPTPNPTTAPVGDASSEKFLISNLPNTVHHDQTFNLNIQLQNLNPNSKYYLKGAFVKEGSSNYFGLTKVNGNWASNSLTYNGQFELTTDNSGNWIGQLPVQVDPADSGFTGVGSYIFKVGRYNASGSGPTWSASTNITIDTEPASPTNTPTPSPTALASSTPLVSSFTSTNNPISYASNEPTISLPTLESSQTATVAGIQLVQANQTLAPILDSAWYIIGGVVLLLLGASPTIYLFLKPRIIDAIHYYKSQRN